MACTVTVRVTFPERRCRCVACVCAKRQQRPASAQSAPKNGSLQRPVHAKHLCSGEWDSVQVPRGVLGEGGECNGEVCVTAEGVARSSS